MHITIGRVAEATGCKVQTIRYYEQIGILPEPLRSEGNQRLYGEDTVERLVFVRHARELGFPLDAVREILSLADNPNQPCEAADAIARRQLKAVERRIASLEALRVELSRMIEHRGGKIADCRVIKVLGDHAQCVATEHAPPVRAGQS